MHGKPVVYEEWLRNQKEMWAARESDPAVVDSIGILQTIALAEQRFVEVVGDHLSFWSNETPGHSGEFAQLLKHLSLSVGHEVGDLWRHDEWHTAWFERACRNKVDEALVLLVKEWGSRARRLEIQHLENSHITLGSLVAAEGNLKIAFTLDQGKKTLEYAQIALDALKEIDSEKMDGKQSVPAVAMTETAVGPDHSALPLTPMASTARDVSATDDNSSQVGQPAPAAGTAHPSTPISSPVQSDT